MNMLVMSEAMPRRVQCIGFLIRARRYAVGGRTMEHNYAPNAVQYTHIGVENDLNVNEWILHVFVDTKHYPPPSTLPLLYEWH